MSRIFFTPVLINCCNHFRRLDIEQVCVCGGRLDAKVDFDAIKEHVDRDLMVALRTTSGKVSLNVLVNTYTHTFPDAYILNPE